MAAMALLAVPSVSSLSWIAGCWIAVDAEKGSEEHWTAPAGGTLLGMSRTVRGGKTVAYEFMEIRETDTLLFIASPSGQTRTTFRLAATGERRVEFENADHDFPQKVIYFRKGEDLLMGRIEGKVKRNFKAIDFPMKRTACP
jgi:hypothetical protein